MAGGLRVLDRVCFGLHMWVIIDTERRNWANKWDSDQVLVFVGYPVTPGGCSITVTTEFVAVVSASPADLTGMTENRRTPQNTAGHLE